MEGQDVPRDPDFGDASVQALVNLFEGAAAHMQGYVRTDMPNNRPIAILDFGGQIALTTHSPGELRELARRAVKLADDLDVMSVAS